MSGEMIDERSNVLWVTGPDGGDSVSPTPYAQVDRIEQVSLKCRFRHVIQPDSCRNLFRHLRLSGVDIKTGECPRLYEHRLVEEALSDPKDNYAT